MQVNDWLSLFYAGTAITAPYIRRRWGLPIGIGAMLLALYELGLNDLANWQFWICVLVLAAILVYIYNANNKTHTVSELQYIWTPWIVVSLGVALIILITNNQINNPIAIINPTSTITTSATSTTPTTTIIIPSFTLTNSGYYLVGTGSYNSPSFPLNSNSPNFTITYDGDGLFTVWLYDQNHNVIALIENESVDGTISDSKNIQVQEGVQYNLQIITGGKWTINIIQ
jgi:hypothetical protein